MASLTYETAARGDMRQGRPNLVQADYPVAGAGAAGMAFVDSLIHNADVHVAMVDRRHGAGGHWSLPIRPFAYTRHLSSAAWSQPRWATASCRPTARKRACTTVLPQQKSSPTTRG